MEARAVVRFARMSPQKARLVADTVRGKKVSEAQNILRFMNKATARIIGKVVASAKANAENANVGNADEMTVDKIFVDQGPVMKRRLARSRGRVDMIRKPFSHVTVILKEAEKVKKARKAAPKGDGHDHAHDHDHDHAHDHAHEHAHAEPAKGAVKAPAKSAKAAPKAATKKAPAKAAKPAKETKKKEK